MMYHLGSIGTRYTSFSRGGVSKFFTIIPTLSGLLAIYVIPFSQLRPLDTVCQYANATPSLPIPTDKSDLMVLNSRLYSSRRPTGRFWRPSVRGSLFNVSMLRCDTVDKEPLTDGRQNLPVGRRD